MNNNKNRLMVILAFLTVLSMLIVHALHGFGVMSAMNGYSGNHFSKYVINILSLVIPIGLLAAAMAFYKKENDHQWVPLLVTLTLSSASISTVIGGEGMIEYHFSIFMVVAILSYYENVKLIFLMTAIFAVEHLAGFLIPFFTILIFGVSHYSLSMILIHVVYLVVTTGATTWQILTKKRYTNQLQKENEVQQATIDQMMEKLADTSQSVLETVKNLKGNSGEFQEEIYQVTASIQQMAAGSDTQLSMAFDSEALLKEMAKGVERIASSSSVLVESFRQTSETANSGKDTLQRTIEQINTVFQSFRGLSEMIVNLEKRSFKINEIIQVISDIANQTNLLALNAAIEAARAGESGMGFSVVADEVRKLAAKSNHSVEMVSKIIDEIQKDTSEAIDSVKVGGEEVKEGILLIRQTEEAFERILDEMKSAYDKVIETSSISTQLSSGSDQVVTSVQKMTDVARETAASSESISKASEKQLVSIENINGIAGYLDNLVSELNTLTIALNNER